MPLVSIAIVTYNKFELFEKCVNAVLHTTAHLDREIIVWDNCSTDNTGTFLEELKTKENITVIHNDKNIGVNGKGMAIRQTTGDYIVGVDDDVIELPEHWVEKMIDAFNKEKKLGYLALDVIQDEHTNGAKPPGENYKNVDYGDGTVLQFGPTGGWCFMVPRNIYNKVGPLRYCKKTIFYREDLDYTVRCKIKGYPSAILKDVKCYHATGLYYNNPYIDIYNNKLIILQDSDLDWHRVNRTLSFLLYRFKKFIGKK